MDVIIWFENCYHLIYFKKTRQ